MQCRQVEKKLDRYIQGDLPEQLSREIAQHIAGCQSCADAFGRIRQLHKLLRDVPVPTIPEDFTERLMEHADDSGPRTIRLWEWFDRAVPRKTVAAAAVIAGLSAGLFMGTDMGRQPHGDQIVASAAVMDTYHFDYLSEAPDNSFSRVYIQMVASGNSSKE